MTKIMPKSLNFTQKPQISSNSTKKFVVSYFQCPKSYVILNIQSIPKTLKNS